MSQLIAHFHFLYPLWLLALLPLPLLLWWLLRGGGGRRQLERAVDARLLPHLLAPTRAGRRLSPWLLTAIWLLLCLALAGPAWQRVPTAASHSRDARVIVLSLADSMLATDLEPNRLTRARFKIRDLLQQGRAAHNALVAYAGEAYVVAPLTRDVDTVLNFLSSLGPKVMPVAGDRADRGIAKAVDLLQQAGFAHGNIVLVADHAGERAVAAARRAQDAGIDVSVLGVGTRQGAPVRLPEGGFLTDAKGDVVLPGLGLEQLQQVAQAGGGIYRTLEVGQGDVRALLAATSHAQFAPGDDPSTQQVQRWRDAGAWLLLLLLPLAALAFRRGWLMGLALVFMLPAGPVEAAPGWWTQLWHNDDQRAAQALAQGHAGQALKQAASPGLRGSAAYRSGDYDAAVKSFSRGEGARAFYNLGNALAQQGQYQHALEAWQQALDHNPELADARANIEAVKEWLAKQKKQHKRQSRRGQKSGKPQSESGARSRSAQGQAQQDKGAGDNSQRQPSGENQNSSSPGRSGSTRSGKAPSQSEQSGRQRQKQQPSASRQAHKDEAGKGEAGKDHKPPQGQSKPAPGSAASTRSDNEPHAPGQAASAQAPPTALGKQQAERQRRQTRAVREALGKSLDPQLGGQDPPEAYRLGTTKPDDDSRLPLSMRQALEGVPEDPGALLRRKFMLEHQRRHQESGS